MESVFRGVNHLTLGNQDSTVVRNELIVLANNIGVFIKNNYDNSFSFNASVNYKELIAMGVAYLQMEQEDMQNNSGGGMVVMSNEVDCIIGTFSSLLGVGEVAALVNSFRNGVSATTLLATAKVMLKRVATVITVAVAVYSFGDCMDWW